MNLFRTSRIDRERRTLTAMVRLFCRRRHRSPEVPCEDCRRRLAYALDRLERCPFGEAKPSCRRCPVHCYAPEPRAAIRAIMRWAGPRMLVHHPGLALRHLRDERRGTKKRHR